MHHVCMFMACESEAHVQTMTALVHHHHHHSLYPCCTKIIVMEEVGKRDTGYKDERYYYC